MSGERPVRVMMPCTGLGRVQRGFETFTRELAGALAGESRVELTVLGGGGTMLAGEHAVWNLPRDSSGARAVGWAVRRGSYFVEQATFFAGMLPALQRSAPDVVYFADINLGNACWHWRRLTGARYRLLYYNGGPTTMPFTRCDVVQHVSPQHLDAALRRGERAERMCLVPHGLTIADTLGERRPAVVARVRAEWGVAPGLAVLLSVGVLAATHKRMDALVEAVAALGEARPHLVMLGAPSSETPALEALARARLGRAVTITTWPRERMPLAYEAADAFALLSLQEGFGLAYLEALAAGLPCVAHDNATTRYIFGDLGLLGDTTRREDSVELLRLAIGSNERTARTARHERARAEYGWKNLVPRYVELFEACAKGRALP